MWHLFWRGFTRDLSGSVALPAGSSRKPSIVLTETARFGSSDGLRPGSEDSVDFDYASFVPWNLFSMAQPLVGSTQTGIYDAAGFPGQSVDVDGKARTFTYEGRTLLREITHQAGGSKNRFQPIDKNMQGLPLTRFRLGGGAIEARAGNAPRSIQAEVCRHRSKRRNCYSLLDLSRSTRVKACRQQVEAARERL